MQSTLFDLDVESQSQSFGGRTSPGFSATEKTPSDAFLALSLGKTVSCSQQGKNGRTLVVCMDPKEQSRGGFLTPNISEWPNDAAVCSLSQVLERGSIPQRYFLSAKACAGILRRAEKRGKVLPMMLHQALLAQAEALNEPEKPEDKTRLSQSPAWPTDKGGAEVAENRSPTLTCNHEAPIAAYPILEPGKRTGKSTTDPRAGLGVGSDGDPMFTLQAGAQHGVCCISGDICHALRGEGFDGSEDGTGRGIPTIAIQNATRGKSQNGLGISDPDAPMFTLDQGSQHGVMVAHGTQDPCVSDNLAFALGRNNGGENAVCFAENSRSEIRLEGGDGQRTGALSTGGGKPGQGQPVVATNLSVRRLMPIECERLQGMPDNHTNIPPWYACGCGYQYPEELGKYGCPNCCGEYTGRLKKIADGPRYKAIGNSMAVPVIEWIGKRIMEALR